MNLITRSQWINRSADEQRTPTFRDAGILLLGACWYGPGRLWARIRRRGRPVSHEWHPTDLHAAFVPLTPIKPLLRDLIPRTKAPGAAIVFQNKTPWFTAQNADNAQS